MGINLAVDRSPVIIIVSAFIIPLTTTLFLLRGYVRLHIQKKRLSADDWVILFSFINFSAVQVLTFLDVKWGTGKHVFDVVMKDPNDLTLTMKSWWIGQHFYIYSTCSVKLSIAIFFCSLSPPRALRITAIIMACISIATGLGTEIYQIFQCWPVDYFWKRFDPLYHGSCISAYKSFVILEVVNSFDILTDVVLALLPAIMLWNMNMRRLQKFGVGLLLGLGAVPAVAAIVRAFYFRSTLLESADFTYAELPIGLTSHLEPAIAICVVCAAHLRPLLRQVVPKTWLTSSKASSNPNIVTFGQAGGRPHGKAEVSIDERLDSGVCDEERLCEKRDSGHIHSSQKALSVLSEESR